MTEPLTNEGMDASTGADRDPFYSPGRYAVLQDISDERDRQLRKWGRQSHPDGTGRPGCVGYAEAAKRLTDERFRMGAGTWEDILNEEFAEACAETDLAALRAELIQVAAVAVAWVEDIDKRGAS